MVRVRRVLTLFALLTSIGVSSIAAVSVIRQGFPTPDPVATLAARDDLVAYLAATDLRPADRRVKVHLIDRLEKEFRQGGDWQPQLDALDSARASRFQDNFAHLMELWFLDKVDRFHELPPEKRDAFLDREIDDILRWKVISPAHAPKLADLPKPPHEPPRDPPPGEGRRRRRRGPPQPPMVKIGGPAGAVVEAVARISTQAQGRQRRRCEEFLAALQLRVITRSFPGFSG